MGVLRAVIYLETIRNSLRESAVDNEAYAWILDATDTILSHPNPSLMGRSLDALIEDLDAGDEETER